MIYTLTAQQLALEPGMICIESDFVLCQDLLCLPHLQDYFQSEMLMVFFCLRGHLQMEVFDHFTQLSAGEAYLCKPLTPVHQVHISHEGLVSLLFFSPQVVDHLLPVNMKLSQILTCDYHSTLHFGRKYLTERIAPQLSILYQSVQEMIHPFATQIVFHLFSTLLFQVLNLYCAADGPLMQVEGVTLTAHRSDALFHLFITLLREDGGRHRTVNYYADKLCITPKYLSRVIKRKTGIRALEVINRHALQQIKQDLKLTDISISQLAAKYEFGNCSFFCLFVKTHLGMTPMAYREQ